MRAEGQRLKRTRLVQTNRFVVAVDVELVIPSDDSSEPRYEAETVQFLQRVREKAEACDVAWLEQHGKVYRAMTPQAVV